jgi:hypothetical protein
MTEAQFEALAAWIKAEVIAKEAPYQDNVDARVVAEAAARAALVMEGTDGHDA